MTKLITPVFRADFPALIAPKQKVDQNKQPVFNKDGSPKMVYSVTMVFDDPNTMDEIERERFEALRKLVDDTAREKWGDKMPSYYKRPFRRGVQKTDENQSGYDLAKYPHYEGKVIVVAQSVNFAPDIVGPDKTPLFGESGKAELYSGHLARATVTAYAYKFEQSTPGVSFGLQNYWKVGDAEPFSKAGIRSTADDDFAGFETPKTAAPTLAASVADL